jgi:putative ABC transport system permease protein
MLVVGAISLAACILGYLSITHSVSSAIAVLIGLMLVMPVLLAPVTSAVAWAFKPFLLAESTIASRQLLRRRLRTALTVGVLFIAVATGIGLASAVLDNISDVRQWYERTLVGDFFVRAMMPDMATGQAADMPDELGAQIEQIPGVTAVDPVRFVKTEVKGPADSFRVVVVAKEFADGQAHFDLKSGDADEVLGRLKQGEIVISTVLATRAGLDVGDSLEVGAAKGDQPPPRLTIAGTTNEYSFGGMTVYLHRRKAEELFDIRGADAFIVKAEPARLREVESSLAEIVRTRGLMLQSWVELSELIDGIVAGIVGALWVILALGFIVATFGIVNTLTMNVLEQTREIGLLRVVAMTRRQIRSTILSQAMIMGVIGIVPGVLAGMGIAWLINLTTYPLVGRLLEFVFHKELIFGGLIGGLAVVLLAAWLPAERATRLPLLESLRRE